MQEGNDFGIMRINQPSHFGAFPDVAWNWYENVDYGKKYYEKTCLKNATDFNRDNKNAIYQNTDKYGRIDTSDHIERDALCRYNRGEKKNLYVVDEETRIASVLDEIGWNYAAEVENIKYTKY